MSYLLATCSLHISPLLLCGAYLSTQLQVHMCSHSSITTRERIRYRVQPSVDHLGCTGISGSKAEKLYYHESTLWIVYSLHQLGCCQHWRGDGQRELRQYSGFDVKELSILLKLHFNFARVYGFVEMSLPSAESWSRVGNGSSQHCPISNPLFFWDWVRGRYFPEYC